MFALFRIHARQAAGRSVESIAVTTQIVEGEVA
jgi:hypothetical protein